MTSSERGRAGKAPERGYVPPGRRFSASLAEDDLYIATPEEDSRWSRGDDPRVPESTTQQDSSTAAAAGSSGSQRQLRGSSSLNREAATTTETEGASSNASAHARTQSLTEDPPNRFICSICYKDYSSKHSLKRHYKDVHSVEIIIKCTRCGEILSAANVDYHLCNHAAGEPTNHDDKNDPSRGPSSGPSTDASAHGRT